MNDSVSASAAIDRLRAGNARYLADERRARTGDDARQAVVSEQHPIAAVLGCADSRVPAEVLFDLGIGELFVVRVAGNVAAPSQIGSIEYAVAQLGVPLVVVLSHTNCGAVAATLASVQQPEMTFSPELNSIVELIQPSVRKTLEDFPDLEASDIVNRCARANAVANAQRLARSSVTLRNFVEQGRLTIVTAEYSLASGRVEFFDGLP